MWQLGGLRLLDMDDLTADELALLELHVQRHQQGVARNGGT